MNPNPARRAALSVSVVVLAVAGCSVTDRKVAGTASAPVDATTPTTSISAAARLVEPATLPSLLGSPGDIAGIVGADMRPGPILKQPFRGLFTEPSGCLDAVMPGQASSIYYARNGFAAQSLDVDAPHVRALQVVASYATVDDADVARTVAASNWSFCQGKSVTLTVNNDVAVQTTGRVETRDSIMSIPVSPAGGDPAVSCQHAFTAKRNVVIDVRICAPNVADMGRQLVSKIAAKLT